MKDSSGQTATWAMESTWESRMSHSAMQAARGSDHLWESLHIRTKAAQNPNAHHAHVSREVGFHATPICSNNWDSVFA